MMFRSREKTDHPDSRLNEAATCHDACRLAARGRGVDVVEVLIIDDGRGMAPPSLPNAAAPIMSFGCGGTRDWPVAFRRGLTHR
jgi:hypothetical protein